MSLWEAGWLLWLAYFAILEGFALKNGVENDTLSEHVWKWFAVKEKGTAWRARRFALLAFMAWLATHFLTGGAF